MRSPQDNYAPITPELFPPGEVSPRNFTSAIAYWTYDSRTFFPEWFGLEELAPDNSPREIPPETSGNGLLPWTITPE